MSGHGRPLGEEDDEVPRPRRRPIGEPPDPGLDDLAEVHYEDEFTNDPDRLVGKKVWEGEPYDEEGEGEEFVDENPEEEGTDELWDDELIEKGEDEISDDERTRD